MDLCQSMAAPRAEAPIARPYVRRVSERSEAGSNRGHGQGDAAPDAKLSAQRRDVVLDGLLADSQFSGDFRVCVAVNQQHEYIVLPLCQYRLADTDCPR